MNFARFRALTLVEIINLDLDGDTVEMNFARFRALTRSKR